MSAEGANMSAKETTSGGSGGMPLRENFEIGLSTKAIFCVPWTRFNYI